MVVILWLCVLVMSRSWL